MPIEIKELLIRAFVSEPSEENQSEQVPIVEKQNSAQDTLAMVANMLKQEKER
jgi:hypothetical protein